MVSLKDLPRGRSAEAKPAHGIDRTEGPVETALSRLEVTIHPDFFAHAYRHGLEGPVGAMDRAACLLPTFVRAYPWEGESVSWW